MRLVHTISGALVLPAYLVLHVWEIRAIPAGRRAFVEAAVGGPGGPVLAAVEALLVLMPLVVHAVTGIWRAVGAERGPHEPYPHRSARTLQRVTGMLALLFVVFHLAHVWWPKLAGWGAARAYDTLRERLAEPAVALLYVVGLTATCAHAAQGLAVAALRTGWLRGSGGRIAAYGTTSVLAALGWIVAMQAVAHLATGATLGPAFLAGAGLGAPRP